MVVISDAEQRSELYEPYEPSAHSSNSNGEKIREKNGSKTCVNQRCDYRVVHPKCYEAPRRPIKYNNETCGECGSALLGETICNRCGLVIGYSFEKGIQAIPYERRGDLKYKGLGTSRKDGKEAFIVIIQSRELLIGIHTTKKELSKRYDRAMGIRRSPKEGISIVRIKKDLGLQPTHYVYKGKVVKEKYRCFKVEFLRMESNVFESAECTHILECPPWLDKQIKTLCNGQKPRNGDILAIWYYRSKGKTHYQVKKITELEAKELLRLGDDEEIRQAIPEFRTARELKEIERLRREERKREFLLFLKQYIKEKRYYSAKELAKQFGESETWIGMTVGELFPQIEPKRNERGQLYLLSSDLIVTQVIPHQ